MWEARERAHGRAHTRHVAEVAAFVRAMFDRGEGRESEDDDLSFGPPAEIEYATEAGQMPPDTIEIEVRGERRIVPSPPRGHVYDGEGNLVNLATGRRSRDGESEATAALHKRVAEYQPPDRSEWPPHFHNFADARARVEEIDAAWEERKRAAGQVVETEATGRRAQLSAPLKKQREGEGVEIIAAG